MAEGRSNHGDRAAALHLAARRREARHEHLRQARPARRGRGPPARARRPALSRLVATRRPRLGRTRAVLRTVERGCAALARRRGRGKLLVRRKTPHEGRTSCIRRSHRHWSKTSNGSGSASRACSPCPRGTSTWMAHLDGRSARGHAGTGSVPARRRGSGRAVLPPRRARGRQHAGSDRRRPGAVARVGAQHHATGR